VPGITASTITVDEMADVSGPVPGLFAGAVDGMDAWAAQVNASGGIDGRKVVVVHKDTALSCSAATTAYKDALTSSFAAVGSYTLVDVCGEPTLKANPTFPDLEASVLTPALGALPNVYGEVPAVNGYATTGYAWVEQKYGLSAVQHTADLYAATAAADYAAQRPAANQVGYKYIYTRAFGNTETNFTADILRMKSDNVQVVDAIDMSAPDLAGFLEQAAQQDFKPDAVINTSGYDPTLFKLTGTVADDNPLMFPLPYAMYLGEDAAAVPEITTMTTWLHKTHPSDQVNLYVMESFAAGLLFQQAMSTLGANPTRAGLLSALSGITNFTADGLVAPSNVGQKKGTYCDVIVRPENGKFVRVDPASGFECNGTFVNVPSS